jgi:Fuc2NAc and GlcNAc transferase
LTTPFLAIALFLISALITRGLVANSHRLSTLDIPNERSSHQIPTPRGGGIAFVATSIIGFLLLLLDNALNGTELLALCYAGSIVAIAGHLDDRQKISGATIRLVLHAIGAFILIVGIGFPSQISIFDRTVNTGIIGSILGVVYRSGCSTCSISWMELTASRQARQILLFLQERFLTTTFFQMPTTVLQQ